MPDVIPNSLEQLKIPARLRGHLSEFVHHLIELYQHDLVSISVFGSAVTGDFTEASSDVNLLVIYSDLNIADLNAVSKLARTWLRKQRFVPRFLSRRNLTESLRYFQIDFLDMRDAHVTVFGEDVLAGVEVYPAGLQWQLTHEIKRMRMRLKQQFWMASDDEKSLRLILLRRFTSLVHLMRALLLLRGIAPPHHAAEIVDEASRAFGLDAAFAQRILALKAGSLKLRGDEIVGAFSGLMDLVRLLDEEIGRTAV